MKKIYLVEDDADIRELVEFLLTDLNFEVTSFATAEDFKSSMLTGEPDLILLDIMLPDGNGSDMCEKLKADEDTSEIPVVLMSAHIDPKLRRESCADDFIPKPFDIDDFTSRIKRQVNREK